MKTRVSLLFKVARRASGQVTRLLDANAVGKLRGRNTRIFERFLRRFSVSTASAFKRGERKTKARPAGNATRSYERKIFRLACLRDGNLESVAIKPTEALYLSGLYCALVAGKMLCVNSLEIRVEDY